MLSASRLALGTIYTNATNASAAARKNGPPSKGVAHLRLLLVRPKKRAAARGLPSYAPAYPRDESLTACYISHLRLFFSRDKRARMTNFEWDSSGGGHWAITSDAFGRGARECVFLLCESVFFRMGFFSRVE